MTDLIIDGSIKLGASVTAASQELYGALKQALNDGHYVTLEEGRIWSVPESVWDRADKAIDAADELWPKFVFDADAGSYEEPEDDDYPEGDDNPGDPYWWVNFERVD